VRYLESLDSGEALVVTGNDIPDELAGAFKCLSPSPCVSRGALIAARGEPPADPASIRAVYLRDPC
jgi:hypothetical protein